MHGKWHPLARISCAAIALHLLHIAAADVASAAAMLSASQQRAVQAQVVWLTAAGWPLSAQLAS